MNRLLVISNVITLIVLLVLLRESPRQRERLAHAVLSEQQAEVLGDVIVLEQLRQTNSANALELLEMGVDSGVAVLANAPRASESEMGHIAGTLEIAKHYREKYPRRRESIIDETNEAAFQKMREKTTSLLSKANSGGQ